MDAHFAQARYYLGAALVHAGHPDEAIAQFDKVKANEYTQQTSALLGYTLRGLWKIEQAQARLNELKSLAKKRYVSPYLEAIVYSGLGDKDKALGQLEKALREKACWMVFLNVDPFLDSLRLEPRFTSLIRRMGLESKITASFTPAEVEC